MNHSFNTHADALHVDAIDPREALAAISWAFGEIPENSLVLVSTAQLGAGEVHSPVARIRLGGNPREAVLASAAVIACRLELSGARELIAVISEDAEAATAGIFSSTMDPENTPSWDDETWVHELYRFFAHGCESMGITIHHIRGEHAITLTGHSRNRELPEIAYSRVGALKDSAFAARCVASGKPFLIDRGKSTRLPHAVRTAIKERWRTLASVATLEGPSDPETLINPTPLLPTASDCQRKNVAEFVTKCERWELIAANAHHGPWRDHCLSEFLGFYYQSSDVGLSLIARILDDPTCLPSSSFSPGGKAFSALETWWEMWELAEESGAPKWLREGLAHLAAQQTLIAWWCGRSGEAHVRANAIAGALSDVSMAQLVADLVSNTVIPPWLAHLESFA